MTALGWQSQVPWRPLLIAELHPQHGGRIDLLKEMMFQASESGVDICKIQVYDSVDTLGSVDWEYLEYSDRDLADLFAFSQFIGMPLFASVFSADDFERISDFDPPAYKIASRSVEEEALCHSLLITGKPVFCSLGMWYEEGLPFDLEAHPNLSYLACVSKYPTPQADATYAFQDFSPQGILGVSDHSVGIGVALAAISHGARIVERHFSLTPYRYRATDRKSVV